jgi:mRNA interferase HigB
MWKNHRAVKADLMPEIANLFRWLESIPLPDSPRQAGKDGRDGEVFSTWMIAKNARYSQIVIISFAEFRLLLIVITVRIVKPSRVRQFGESYPDAVEPLMAWLKIARKARWRNLNETRQVFPHADGVKVASGSTVTVFNIGGNKYRLIVALHCNTGVAYVLRFFTHADYDRKGWKDEL